MPSGKLFRRKQTHTPAAVAGTEIVQFSPTDLLNQTEAAIAKAMQKAAD